MSYIMELRKLVGNKTLLMPCAGAIIGDGNGNILLQQRADDKTWASHGGSVELDESVENTMIREIKEELGLKTESLDEYLPKELHSDTTKKGYLQIVPGIHDIDGFFISRFVKSEA